MPPLLTVTDLTITAKADISRPLVNKLSFNLEAGDALGIVGESGSGKSLTAQALMRLLPHPAVQIESGDLIFDGESVLDLSSKQLSMLRGGTIAMIFQEPMTAFNPVKRIGNQVVEQIRLHNPNWNKQKAYQHCLSIFIDVGLKNSESVFHSYPHELSGGMRQRAMIAMALSCSPKLLIADEPTTALDVELQAQILELISSLKEKYSLTLIFISHDLAVVANLCTEILVMYKGEQLEKGSCSEVLQTPKHSYTKALIHCNPTSETAHRSQLASIANEPISLNGECESAQQRNLRFEAATRHINVKSYGDEVFDAKPEHKVLEISEVKKSFAAKRTLFSIKEKRTVALENTNLSLHKGETLGIVGASGSGKSTLSRIISGLMKPDSGKVIIDGCNIDELDRKTLATKIQYIFQDPLESLNPRFTVRQMLCEPLIIHGIKNKGIQDNTLLELLDLINLPESALDKYPHEFSGGQRQRIGIARALVLKPDILICDEPVSALDVSIQAQILNLLIDIQHRLNIGIIFISHDLTVVKHIAHNIAVMSEGVVVEFGDSHSIYTHPEHSYTKKLIAAAPSWPDATSDLA